MRERLEQLFSDFYARDLPDLTPRNAYYPVLPHKATVVMGMRRTGKTWFCYQKMRDLLASGTDKSRLLYINFEDDRLLGFAVSNPSLTLEFLADTGVREITVSISDSSFHTLCSELYANGWVLESTCTIEKDYDKIPAFRFVKRAQ